MNLKRQLIVKMKMSKICFPAVSLNGLGLCNDGVVESARTTKKVDRKPVNVVVVVLGRVRGKQVGDKLCESWSLSYTEWLGCGLVLQNY